MSASRDRKTVERCVFPALIAVPLAFWGLSELRPYLGEREKISVLVDGVAVVSDPFPLDRGTKAANRVIGELRQGEIFEVYRDIYGKDYLMYEVRFQGRKAYVQSDSREISQMCPADRDC
ncbi:MAG: hypothetical protein AB7F09_29345 [Parvibaculaceae bacterium]